MRTKKEKVEVLQQTIYSRKKTGKKKIGMMKILALTLYLLATLTIISSTAILLVAFETSIFMDLT